MTYERLDEIALRYRVDKSSAWHGYTRWYARHLEPYVGQAVTLLEVGIMYGQSLRVWKEYLGPKARVVGVDNNLEYLNEALKDGLEVETADQNDLERMRELAYRYAPDIIIDDGSHEGAAQRATFQATFLPLREGGLYVIEDLHTAYWGWGGNFLPDIYAMVDDVNTRGKCDWGRVMMHPERLPKLTQNERTTIALHVYPSVLFIEKGDKALL